MASPQTQKGHIRIANDLYDRIMLSPFTKRELLIVLAIMRKTYGFSKKTAQCSYYELSGMTGIRREMISNVVGCLEKRRVIHVHVLSTSPQGYTVKEIGLNKNYDEWIHVHEIGTSPKRVRTQKGGMNSTQKGGMPCTQNDTQVNTNKQTNNPPLTPPTGFCLKAWSEYETHRREIKARKLKPASVEKLQQWLVDQGDENTQQAIVDQTVRNGWTGLFELKNGNGNGTHSGNGTTDTRSRAKRVSDKLAEIAIASDAEEMGGSSVRSVSGSLDDEVDPWDRGH